MSDKRITNGGVKRVVVRETQDPDFITVAIIDREGVGDTLARFMLRKDHVRPVPTQVEDHLLDNFLMGPSWTWIGGWGKWEGQFASITNHKVSDNFRWTE